jgi:hypothetical protein
VPTDASSWPDVSRLAARAVEEFGRIDTWVNCFAVSTYGTVDELSAEEIERVIDVTLLGQIYGMKAAAAQMRKQGSGKIVSVASALARRSVPLQAPYCAAKHDVVGFGESPAPRARPRRAGRARHDAAAVVGQHAPVHPRPLEDGRQTEADPADLRARGRRPHHRRRCSPGWCGSSSTSCSTTTPQSTPTASTP